MSTTSTTTRSAKFRDILDVLRTEISSGHYDSHTRLPSESELVQRFGVSRPTVARAFRELQTEGFIERRAGSGTYLKQNQPTATGLLGLIVPALGNTEIFDPICAEIARMAHETNHTLLWGGSWPEGWEARVAMAEELCQRYIQQKVSGVFFAPLELTEKSEAINSRIAAALEKAGIPVVLLDRDLYAFPQRSNFDLVGIDNFTAGYQLARHLIEHGCRRISFLELPHSAPTVDLRVAGWREAMVRAKLDCGPERVHIGDPSDERFVRAMLTAGRPEAIICANDMTAAKLMQTLNRIGRRVPEDIRLAGFDDLKYATLLSVPLTTMHQPCRAIADAAVEALLERIKKPELARREILLDAELVVRQSCGTHPKDDILHPPSAARHPRSDRRDPRAAS